MQVISLPCPLFVRHSRLPRWAQRLTKALMAPSGAARDDDRDLADRRRDPVAGFGDLAGEAQIVPGRPLEDALLLDPVLFRVGIKAERDFADPVRWPRDGTIKPGILPGSCTDIGGPPRKRRKAGRHYAPEPHAASRPRPVQTRVQTMPVLRAAPAPGRHRRSRIAGTAAPRRRRSCARTSARS